LRYGGRAGQRQAVPVENVPEQGGEIAAVADDGLGDLPPQRVARHDSEVATDIGENRAGRAAADLGRDVPGRGQTGDAWFACVGAAVLGLGGARLARGWGDADGIADAIVDVLANPGRCRALRDARRRTFTERFVPRRIWLPAWLALLDRRHAISRTVRRHLR
jgi:hypothetical protein